MGYCILKNLNIFAKQVSNLAFIFGSHSFWEENVSHLPMERLSWKQKGTTMRLGQREESIKGWSLLIRRTQGGALPTRVAPGECGLAQSSAMLKVTRQHACVDIVGIHPDMMCHRLNIDSQAKLVLQKRRALDADRSKALQNEVDHLLRIGFIRESYYPDWLSNPMLVPKSNGKWRICIDFTNLNKACLKDNFPLP